MNPADTFKALGPVRLAFLGSLLLSLIAAMNGALINKDGIFYVEAARAILEQGVGMMRQNAALQFLPLLTAALSKLTGLRLEAAAHLLNALFLAGACSLVVAITRRRLPEAAWAACLVVLAMPAYNGYRGDILREFGFWFFSILAFWLAMRWEESNRLHEAIAAQLALGCAALFRLEAIAFFPALMLWQAFAAPSGHRLRRACLIGCLPLAGIVVAAVLYGMGMLSIPDRLAYYLEAANPARKIQLFKEAGIRMTEAVFRDKYSREEAAYVLFFGLLSIIPVKFIKMTGVFVVPLGFQLAARQAGGRLARWQPMPWAFLTYVFVLSAFVTHNFFLTGRYVSMLNMLAVPIVAAGLILILRRFPRWRMLLMALALVTMISNVVSISPKKTHVVEAGTWLGQNAPDASRVGVDNARIAYYAGWNTTKAVIQERQELAKALSEKRLDMIALESSGKDTSLDAWMASNRLHITKRFSNKAGDAVVVVEPENPVTAPPPASAVTPDK